MHRLIWRQRRRLLFTTLFLFCALFLGLVSGGGLDFGLGPLYGQLLLGTASLITAFIGATMFAILLPILPDWRYIVELLGIMLFIEMALGLVFPTYFGVLATSALASILWFVVFVCVYSLTYGPWLDRFPLSLSSVSARSVTIAMSAAELWPRLLPGLSPIEDHWDDLLVECVADEDEEDTYHLSYSHGHGLFEPMTITYLEIEPGKRAKYFFQGNANPKNRTLVQGTYEVELTDLPDGKCTLTLREHRESMLPRVGLSMWFDDSLGDQLDHIRATLRGQGDWSIAGRYRRKAASLA